MKKLAFLVCTLTMLALVPGCADGDEGGECVAGVACICREDCSRTCGGSGADCAFECHDGATCSFTCPGGGCGGESFGAASMTLSCAGDGCGLNCHDTDSCQITDCEMGCALQCGGAGTCENSCSPFDGGCATTP
jgi:hypothetical protein